MYSCLITTVLSTLRSFPLCKTRLWRLSESTLAAAFFMAMRLHCYNGEISPISHIQTPVWSGTGWQWAEIVWGITDTLRTIVQGWKTIFFYSLHYMTQVWPGGFLGSSDDSGAKTERPLPGTSGVINRGKPTTDTVLKPRDFGLLPNSSLVSSEAAVNYVSHHMMTSFS